jgi:hypothetical protein
MRAARNGESKGRADGDELFDADVPAAVVCAQCGDADCSGCFDEQTKSGVVALVPWERRGAPVLSRLWATARATTLNADGFFDALPDGPLGPALRFAVVSELIAATAMAVAIFLPVAALAPSWTKHLFVEEGATFARLVAAGVPGLAMLLVAAHAAHGWALDFGSRKSGVRRATRRAVRFGLYSAGWDLVVGPLGAIVLTLREGLGAGLSVAGLGMGLPSRSARAFLRGCYGLEGVAAGPAMRASYVAAAVATTVGAVAVLAAILVVLFT